MSDAEQHDDLLTTKEVAERCRVSRKTVTVWARSGQLEAIRLPGGDLRFRRGDVDDLLTPTPTEVA